MLRGLPPPLALATLLLAPPALADGLWDAGLMQGGWRSDYADPAYGTAASPLRFAASCPWPESDFAFCPSNFRAPASQPDPLPRRVFRAANWVDQVADPQGRYWVVGANSEPALDAACNSGPPNQSEPIGQPLQDLYGLALQPQGDPTRAIRQEWLLALDLGFRPAQLAMRPECRGSDFIPYLGVGISSERGGGGAALARVGDGLPAPELRLRARLEASNAQPFAAGEAPPPRPHGQHAGFWVEAQWGGQRRWAWITLFSTFDRGEQTYAAPWNWAIEGSFHFPGADIVVSALPALRRECPAVDWQLPEPAPAAWLDGLPKPVRVDLAALFRCLAPHFRQPPPAAPFPITGVHLWIEVGVRERDGLPGLGGGDYDSRLAMAFDSLDLVPLGSHPFASDAAFLSALWEGALGRPASAVERQRIERLGAGGERTEAGALLLRDRRLQESAIAALRLQQVAFAGEYDLALFTTQRAALRDGRQDLAAASRELALHPRLLEARRRLGDAGLVDRLYASALGEAAFEPATRARLEARFGSAAQWTAALARGEATLGDLLHRLVLLARTLDERNAALQVALLYQVFLGLWPDASGSASWRAAGAMPERLLEALYYAPDVRARWLPPAR
jgi:hypothetical protein